MATKNPSLTPFDYFYGFIGIASDEPIWKVVWSVNQALEIELGKRELDQPHQLPEDLSTKRLFSQTELKNSQSAPAYFEDAQSDPKVEYALFENNLKTSPKQARIFRYIFLLRSEQILQETVPPLIDRLMKADFILSATDLSSIKNIQRILP